MRRNLLMIFECRPGVDWRSSLAIEKASSAFASTTNGVYVSGGPMEMPTMSRLSITIERCRR